MFESTIFCDCGDTPYQARLPNVKAKKDKTPATMEERGKWPNRGNFVFILSRWARDASDDPGLHSPHFLPGRLRTPE